MTLRKRGRRRIVVARRAFHWDVRRGDTPKAGRLDFDYLGGESLALVIVSADKRLRIRHELDVTWVSPPGLRFRQPLPQPWTPAVVRRLIEQALAPPPGARSAPMPSARQPLRKRMKPPPRRKARRRKGPRLSGSGSRTGCRCCS